MKRILIILLALCGCAKEPVKENVPLVFRGTKAGDPAATLSKFHYLTYDYVLGSWVGELGALAVPDAGTPGLFVPADATRVYWPEGKTYSFYAVGYNEALPVDESDVEFGSSMMIYSSGTSAVLVIRNPGHNVDWLAAKNVSLGKTDGIPLAFRHICAKISNISLDLSAYEEWLQARELDISDIKMVYCTLTDAEEQSFVYSSSSGSMFNRESWDYLSSPARTLDPDNLPYFAFPGKHKLEMRVQTVDGSGAQRIDDRVLAGEVSLPMGADCELSVRINPDDRDLTIEVVAGIAAWQSGGSGIVNE